jgi:hypothetical protein
VQTDDWFPREVPPSLEDLLDHAAIQRIIQDTEANKPIEWQFGAEDLRCGSCFAAVLQRRRRSTEVMTSIRRSVM